jgi:hypothetical protein
VSLEGINYADNLINATPGLHGIRQDNSNFLAEVNNENSADGMQFGFTFGNILIIGGLFIIEPESLSLVRNYRYPIENTTDP